VARSGDKLNQVAADLGEQFGITVKPIALDLASAAMARVLFDRLQGEGVVIDVLVNNAGFGVFGEFARMSEDEILGQIQLNVTALTHLTRLFLPGNVGAETREDYERGVHGGVSAGTADGRVLRDQGVCAFIFRGAGE